MGSSRGVRATVPGAGRPLHCSALGQTTKVTDKPEESGMEVSRSEEGWQGKTRMVLLSMIRKTSTVKVTRPW